MIKCTSEIIFTLDSITVITLSLSLLMSKEYFGDTLVSPCEAYI